MECGGCHCGSGRTCGNGRVWACLRSRCCCCCCCRAFICISCCCDGSVCREGGCIMAPERRCSMFDRACLVLLGTKEPVGSSLEPPVKPTRRKGFRHINAAGLPHFTKTQKPHLLRPHLRRKIENKALPHPYTKTA